MEIAITQSRGACLILLFYQYRLNIPSLPVNENGASTAHSPSSCSFLHWQEHKLLKMSPLMARQALALLTQEKGRQQNPSAPGHHIGRKSAVVAAVASSSIHLDSNTDVPALLMYCLSDLNPTGASDDPCLKQLMHLLLLPVLSGEVIEIQPR
jgi:hypothetical protein